MHPQKQIKHELILSFLAVCILACRCVDRVFTSATPDTFLHIHIHQLLKIDIPQHERESLIPPTVLTSEEEV